MRIRRRYGRSVINSWDMRYRAKGASGAPNAYCEGRLVNVGKGGACFETDRELALGSHLDVKLTADSFPYPILAASRVVWCRQSRVTTMYEVGIEFLETSWDTQARSEL